jgi:hypothetical protein
MTEYMVQPRNSETMNQLLRLRACYEAYISLGGDRLIISDELENNITLSMTKMDRYSDERYGFFLFRSNTQDEELLEYHFSNMTRPEIIDVLCTIVEERTQYHEQDDLLYNR